MQMKRLDLSNDDASELDAALSRELRSLRIELAGTEDREFKADLRGRLDRLERIAARLTASIRQGSTKTDSAVDSRRGERLAQPEGAEAEAEELAGRDPVSLEQQAEAAASNPDTAEERSYQLRAASQQESDEERLADEVTKTG